MKSNYVKLLALTVLTLSLLTGTRAFAIYGVDYGEGYFDHHDMCTTSRSGGDIDGDGTQDCMVGSIDDSKFYVLPSNSLSSDINSADELYGLLHDYNGSSDSRKKAGSGFIVNTMLGVKSDDANKDISDDMWKDLKARLRTMDANHKIRWTGSYTYSSISSFYTKYYYNRDGDERNNKDVAFYEMDGGQTDPAIRFYDDSNNIIYVLSRVCGNPVGGLNELPEAKKWEVSVKSEIQNRATLPLTIGSTVSWKHTIKNDGPDKTDMNIDYRYEDGGVLGGGHGADHEFSKGADDGDDESFISTSRPITQNDVGGQMCRSTSAVPKSWDSDDRITSSDPSNECVTIPYDYTLTPFVAADHEYIETNVDFNITPSVANAGPTYSRPSDWKLTQIVMNSGDNVSNTSGGNSFSSPCDYFDPAHISASCQSALSGNNNTVFDLSGNVVSGDALRTYIGNTGSSAIGTKICYAMSVKSRASNPITGEDTQWAHSAPRCLIISKNPKIQILSGDFATRGLVKTSTTDKNIAGLRRFGSWSEYGMYANGSILGMASGSAYAGAGLMNTSVCRYSTLSFANVRLGDSECANDPTTIGRYTNTSSIPDVAGSFLATGATIFGDVVVNDLPKNSINSVVDTYNADSIRLGASTISAGRSIVIKATGTVTIIGNQTYSDGPYSRISQLPQLIIIANKIIIQSNVTNVDAWLVAHNDAKTGQIETCEIVGDTSDKCNIKLTVNGPVMTDKLYLYRTAGSDADAASGEPAEVFNLRSDTYLWSLSQSRSGSHISTVYTTELPPRF